MGRYTYDKFAEEAPQEVAQRLKAQARAMFALADSVDCRHHAVASHFGEAMDPCGTSCDVCLEADVLAEAKVESKRPKPKRHTPADDPEAAETFERLRRLRAQVARENSVPAYVVFTDATLLHMANEKPDSIEALAAIPGVGPKRLQRYGEPFLEALLGDDGLP